MPAIQGNDALFFDSRCTSSVIVLSCCTYGALTTSSGVASWSSSTDPFTLRHEVMLTNRAKEKSCSALTLNLFAEHRRNHWGRYSCHRSRCTGLPDLLQHRAGLCESPVRPRCASDCSLRQPVFACRQTESKAASIFSRNPN